MSGPNQSGWKPGTPTDAIKGDHGPDTVTGNRALMLEQPLIFEIGDSDTTGVDFAAPDAMDLAGAGRSSDRAARPAPSV